MGDFSRDPEVRLADATAKHYVGHRVQQGVPLLDADLHLLDGLHRGELEGVGRWMLGNGVPVGSDAFRVVALAGGGQKTVVLKAKTVGPAASSIAVDVASSTAAAALGFGPANAAAARWGDSPAQLTSAKTEPFVLAAGLTLSVIADGGAPETVTFVAPDFANIAAATAAEVAAKIAASAVRATAVPGAGNDVYLTGGDGTTAGAGRILVDGRMALIESGLRYSEQPLYQNAALAAAWGVTPVGPMPTPTVNQTQTVFVDIWHREVGRAEDAAIVDSRIGIETAVSVRREWAVRVTPSSDYPAALAAKPAGHSYYPLAQLKRGANNPAIVPTMVVDQRDTDASLRPAIAFHNDAGVVVVDTERFKIMLQVTRDGARSFLTYITATFITPPTATLAIAEIAGLEALGAIASVADQALSVIHAQALGTRGAMGIMQQLYDVEKRFVTVWAAQVLPFLRGGSPVYQTAFGTSITAIKLYLDGPAPGGGVAVAPAIAAGNLDGAVTSQERIAADIGGQAGKPIGTLALKYLGSVSPLVLRNVPIDLKYEASGSVTPDDDLDPHVFLDAGWSVSFKNGDGSTPFALHGGPGTFTKQFFVTVTPPDTPTGQTLFSVELHARKNPGGLTFLTTQKTLQINAAPPPSEEQYEVRIKTASVTPSGGVYPVHVTQQETITFRVENHTAAAIAVDLEPSTSAVWTITKGAFALTNQPVAATNGADFQWAFRAPATPGNALTFTLRARDHANPATVFAEIVVSLNSIP